MAVLRVREVRGIRGVGLHRLRPLVADGDVGRVSG